MAANPHISNPLKSETQVNSQRIEFSKTTTFLQFKQQFGKPKCKTPESIFQSPRRGSFDMVDAERDRNLFKHFMHKKYQLETRKLDFIEKWLVDSNPDDHADELFRPEKCKCK